eukprot:COSAG01_NODE_2132_length_8354_cov_19.152271_5_plen_176_part_00
MLTRDWGWHVAAGDIGRRSELLCGAVRCGRLRRMRGCGRVRAGVAGSAPLAGMAPLAAGGPWVAQVSAWLPHCVPHHAGCLPALWSPEAACFRRLAPVDGSGETSSSFVRQLEPAAGAQRRRSCHQSWPSGAGPSGPPTQSALRPCLRRPCQVSDCATRTPRLGSRRRLAVATGH